jgi:hypothetical protein
MVYEGAQMFGPNVGIAALLGALVALGLVVSRGQTGAQDTVVAKVAGQPEKYRGPWTETFYVEPGELGPTGRNPYFVLEPGFYAVLKSGDEVVTKTVLDETKKVGDVVTRVVEEKETKKGKVTEISRNFYAISKRTNSVYYFGEDVDVYEGGKVVGHGGAWLAGVNGARFGLKMPGTPLLGGRYYQELAPKVALDRAEIVSLTETVKTPAGTFKNCLKTVETTPLERGAPEDKYYAAGVGLVKDDKHELVKYGFHKKAKK